MKSIVTTGTFDGIHRGHRLLLDRLEAAGAERGLEPVVVTFDRHPLAVIAPQRAPLLLMLPDVRDSILRDRYGLRVDRVAFDDTMRALTAARWMEHLRDTYAAAAVMIGYDNTFGCDGSSMSVADYERIGAALGMEVLEAPVLAGISSSAARKALARGDIDTVNDMLGYSWTLSGPVVHGQRMGRKIGFRTANMEANPQLQLPAPGVYCTEVILPDGTRRPGVTNIGRRPTFDRDGAMSVETHIPVFDQDIYGQRITIRPLRFLRTERRFDSVDDLRNQIRDDIRACASDAGTHLPI